MKKNLLFYTILLFISSCSTPGGHLTDAENAWFNTGGSRSLYYCTAKPEPKCVRAEMVGGGDEHVRFRQ